jgi:sigma-B regulation protein RsbU (phosphoserine phosphatase)
MTRNLTSLTDGAEQLARGNLETRVPVQSSDEFGQLALSFNRMARDLKVQQENLVKQERLQKELEMCHHIQKEMLPSHPLHLPFAEIHGVSIPAREVGGDFFNYFCLEEHKVALLIGDVSGKGVPAALLMANIQATLRAKLPLSDDLSALMKQLDDEIDKNTPSESYLTLFVAILDGEEKTLRWVNAGHNTQYILKEDGKLEHLSSTGRPVGLLPGGDYEERVVSLDNGDSIFLYTDGLVEAENRLEQEFGDQRLETLLLEGRNEPSEALLARVEQSVCTHRGARETHDDATMVILKTARA